MMDYIKFTIDVAEKNHAISAGMAKEQYASICKERDEVSEKNQYLINFITSLQWCGELNGWLACPSCHGLKKEGHKKDCELIRLAGVEIQ